jgi:hypothetical protein
MSGDASSMEGIEINIKGRENNRCPWWYQSSRMIILLLQILIKWFKLSITNFIEIRNFGHFDVNVIMWHKVGEYGLEGGVWNVIQHEKSKNS